MTERMPFAGHRTCEQVRTGKLAAEPERGRVPAVMATFQPLRDAILLHVQGANPAGVELSIEEARRIHAAISQALKLAESKADPVGAVG